MKTIIEANEERFSRIRTAKKLSAEENREITYKRFPELRKIDADIMNVRTSRMICSIEHDREPLPALDKMEADLYKKREQFLADNGIASDFDKEPVFCAKCGDTGFVKAKDGRRVVCTACMKDALEEVYEQSGMGDFRSYTLKNFDIGYFKDDGRRAAMFGNIRRLIEGKTDRKLMLLTGGTQTGKTYLAVVACKYAAIEGMSSYYVKADRLSRIPQSDLDVIKNYDLVVIDDFQAEVTADKWNAAALHTLLEARLASGRATVIVSMSPLEVLVADSDERIAGKIRGAGII